MSEGGLFSKSRIVAGPGFSRWRIPPVSVAIHLCIGSVYAWSIFNPVLIKSLGVVASAADDWSLASIVWVFTAAIVTLGLAAAFAGKWLERVGPRLVGTVAAVCWGGGFVIGGLGIRLHELWLLYLGYGVLGGIGLGLGYVSPVSTLIRWFPDRRGMAAGIAIMGFGGGAILAAPLKEALIQRFYRAPDRLGTAAQGAAEQGAAELGAAETGAANRITLVTIEGRRYAEVEGQRREVVVVAENEVSRMIVPGPPGVYLVGTGETGAGATFFTLGGVYFVVMLVAAFCYRVPPEGWSPPGWTPLASTVPVVKEKSLNSARGYVSPDQALHTPQFYLLWLVLFANVTAGIGLLGVAKTMVVEIFGAALPEVATAEFAKTYVIVAGCFNMLGRFFWASASDYLGRRRVYTIFFLLGIALFVTIPQAAGKVAHDPWIGWLILFCAATWIIMTLYGGGFATIPAYLADLFGTRYVGAIHGRLLTAWSMAGLVGPLALTTLRQSSVDAAIHDLSSKIPPAIFEKQFGAPVDELDVLIRANTVTIPKLLALTPSSVPDPTSTVYNSTMYTMAGLLVFALIANLLVRPVAAQHWSRGE